VIKGLRYARSLRTLWILILLLTAVSSMLWADKLDTEELIDRATHDLYPEFMEANSKALVAGYIILERQLDELARKVGDATQDRQAAEFWEAFEEGKRGNHIDICYHPQEIENIFVGEKGRHLYQLGEDELLDVTQREGYSAQERQAAAMLLVQRAIEDAGAQAGIEISSWWAFRRPKEYELYHFDPLKLKLQGWMWYSGRAPELAAATITPLAQMYLAEHFAWWEQDPRNPERGRYHEIIQTQLECPMPEKE
jgi:hypothetical protein